MIERQMRRKRKKVDLKRFIPSMIGLCIFLGGILLMVFVWRSRTYPPPVPTEHQISYNRTAKRRNKNDIQYIVIHDTANKNRGADAAHHYHYFNSGNRRSSADYFVDGQSVLKVNDYYSYYTWHCGDGNGKYGITNQNSIGVEICVNRDGNYKRAVQNAANLVKELMAELNVDAEHVVRHFDASGKNCPADMQDNSWKAWLDFKERLLSENEG